MTIDWRSIFPVTFSFLIIDSRGGWQLARQGNIRNRPFRALPGRSRVRWRSDTCKQDGKNAGEKDAVECPGAANRGDWSAKVTDPIEIEKIGTNQRSHRAADIGKWRRVLAGEDEREDCRGHDRREYRHGDTNSRHRRRH